MDTARATATITGRGWYETQGHVRLLAPGYGFEVDPCFELTIWSATYNGPLSLFRHGADISSADFRPISTGDPVTRDLGTLRHISVEYVEDSDVEKLLRELGASV